MNFDKSIEMIKKIWNIKEFNRFNEGKDNYFSQLDIIRSILKRQNTFVIIPTAGGKSICFQAPGICLPGVTIVISPLTALIDDQVDSLNEKLELGFNKNGKVRYRAISPGVDGLYGTRLLDEIVNPKEESVYKFLYISPEAFDQPRFFRQLAEYVESGDLKISQIVFDEVHCLSQWGFDFRESYLNLLCLINRLRKLKKCNPVISAFTATATKRDIYFIERILFSDKCINKFFCIRNRDNLDIKMINCVDYDDNDVRMGWLIDLLCDNPEKKTIVFTRTIESVENIYNELSSSLDLNGRKILYFHGDLGKKSKIWIQDIYKNHNFSILVSTKAFGMGVDISDIELIVNFDFPQSFEEYYQEIGRARGNGLCYLLCCRPYKNKMGGNIGSTKALRSLLQIVSVVDKDDTLT